MAHKPSGGKYSGRVPFFDVGAPKTLYVYSLAIMFRVTSCDRLPAKTIKPFEEGRIPHLQILFNPHGFLGADQETTAHCCIRKANGDGEQYLSMFQPFKRWFTDAPEIRSRRTA
jgi:hypothetical protein